MSEMNNLKIVIIGASVSGLSVATRARRINEKADITIIDESEYINYPITSLPVLASGTIKKIEFLDNNNEKQLLETFNIKLLKRHRAFSINKKTKNIKVLNLEANETFNIGYDKLIIACGNKVVIPNSLETKTKNVFTLKKFEDAIRIREYIDKTATKEITIIGINYYSLMSASYFINNGFEVTFIDEKVNILKELDDEFNFFLKEELLKIGVKLHLNSSIKKFIKSEEKVVKIELSNEKVIQTQLLVFFEKFIPNSTCFTEAGLNLSDNQKIIVNNFFQTKDSSIFAIGNIAKVNDMQVKSSLDYCMLSNSQLQGRIAGTLTVVESEAIYKNNNNSILLNFKTFNLGLTGLNEKDAKKLGFDPYSITVFSGTKERFLPGVEKLHFKLIIDKTTRKILGAQFFSKGNNIDKRLDVISTAIYSELTIDDLIQLNMTSHPEINTYKDPINLIGMIAVNRLSGLSNTVSMNDILFSEDICLLDVRNKSEYDKSHIENSKWIPLNELRIRLDEIPNDKNIYVYDSIGLRGYIAERLLKGNGFQNIFNIEGGLTAIKIFENMK